MEVLALRPCGACHAYVPVDTGCVHWKIGRSIKAEKSRNDRLARKAKAERAHAELVRQMTPRIV